MDHGSTLKMSICGFSVRIQRLRPDELLSVEKLYFWGVVTALMDDVKTMNLGVILMIF